MNPYESPSELDDSQGSSACDESIKQNGITFEGQLDVLQIRRIYSRPQWLSFIVLSLLFIFAFVWIGILAFFDRGPSQGFADVACCSLLLLIFALPIWLNAFELHRGSAGARLYDRHAHLKLPYHGTWFPESHCDVFIDDMHFCFTTKQYSGSRGQSGLIFKFVNELPVILSQDAFSASDWEMLQRNLPQSDTKHHEIPSCAPEGAVFVSRLNPVWSFSQMLAHRFARHWLLAICALTLLSGIVGHWYIDYRYSQLVSDFTYWNGGDLRNYLLDHLGFRYHLVAAKIATFLGGLSTPFIAILLWLNRETAKYRGRRTLPVTAWFSPDRIADCYSDRSFDFPRQRVKRTKWTGAGVEIKTDIGTVTFISRRASESESEWERIRKWLTSTGDER